MSIPYSTIIIGIALFLGILAFIESEARGRIFLATVMILLLILPFIFPKSLIRLLCIFGWFALGIGSYLYLKWHGFW